MKDYEKKYQLLREEKLEDIHSTGYLIQHVKSKAHVLVIANDDENKVFNISFRTRPSDSTCLLYTSPLFPLPQRSSRGTFYYESNRGRISSPIRQ